MIQWVYTRRYNIKAVYDQFPHSNVIFRLINQYYFVYIVNWSEKDPVVTRDHLEKMEILLNKELGTEEFYRSRKSYVRRSGSRHMKKAMVIVNPSSGKEQAKQYVEQIDAKLRERGYTTDVRQTEKEGDATLFAEEACENQIDVLVSMGGDGTLNETINGMAEKEFRPKLGVIPLGTVNDFARALDIPLEAEEAITLLDEDRTQKADIGKIGDHYFLNILAVGGIAEATAEVTADQKTSLGALAYLIEGIKTLKEKTPFDLKVQADGQNWEGEALIFLAALTNSVGGFEKLAPKAEPNDGVFHCFIIKDVALPKFIKLMTSLLRGQLGEEKDVIYMRANEVELYSKTSLKANIDGDIGEELPLRLHVLSRHIEVFSQH